MITAYEWARQERDWIEFMRSYIEEASRRVRLYLPGTSDSLYWIKVRTNLEMELGPVEMRMTVKMPNLFRLIDRHRDITNAHEMYD